MKHNIKYNVQSEESSIGYFLNNIFYWEEGARAGRADEQGNFFSEVKEGDQPLSDTPSGKIAGDLLIRNDGTTFKIVAA